MSKRSRAVAKGMKQKQWDDNVFRGSLIVGVGVLVIVGGVLGVVLFILIAVGAAAAWARE